MARVTIPQHLVASRGWWSSQPGTVLNAGFLLTAAPVAIRVGARGAAQLAPIRHVS